ncbi:seryl-tRNA synthetase [Ascodesmis nigricans]|uniref:serine--tRNA ligase n=1 Tax=Ascodesmis nigricans TaxID=341454 RepID=A0A4S2N6R1_9PEZI|nr:seryl-tRNA synthetase [Ascodesmis nigricans]
MRSPCIIGFCSPAQPRPAVQPQPPPSTMPPRISTLHLPRRPVQLRDLRILPRRLQSTKAPSSAAPTAPKAQVNLKAIRSNPSYHAQNCINRNYAAYSEYPDRIACLHHDLVTMQQALRGDRERANDLLAQIRRAESKEHKAELVAQSQQLKMKLSAAEEKEHEIEHEMARLAAVLPNATSRLTPIGAEPKVLEYLNPHLAPGKDGAKPEKEYKSHVQIGSELKLLDFSDAGAVSGHGWYYLLNEAVLLEQALINYALFLAVKKGWTMASTPSMVWTHMASACGFQPRDQSGEQQIYTTNDGRHALAGTAEIPLAGINANKTILASSLPQKIVGVGRSFRAEAGAYGLDAKGLYRVHEFTKVELFSWAPSPAETEARLAEEGGELANPVFDPMLDPADLVFAEMLELQKTFLTSLGLYARVLEMPSHDLGASAARKIDIEAWMPGRAAKDPWGEVTSLSNCTDYQTRRLNTRMKMNNGKTSFPYTLNGTACAVPRVLLAILENGWDEERRGVVIPEVLRPYLGGMDFIGKKK